jgi:ABC-2 type transport system ATP-binding protein
VVAAGTTADLTGSGEVLTFTAVPALDLTGLIARLPEGCTVAECPQGVYRLDGGVGPDLLASVTAWCAEQGVLPRELSTGRRSLEDVFLELTGRGLR